MFMYVLLYLGQLSHFPSCFGAGVTNLNEPPSSFLLPPHYCGLGAGSIPFRAIVNNKQCEMRGLFILLVIHAPTGDVQDVQVFSQSVSASEMTYIVSGGALNSTNSTQLTLTEPWFSKCLLQFIDAELMPRSTNDRHNLLFLSFVGKIVTIRRRPSNPWFDSECRQSKRVVRRLERS